MTPNVRNNNKAEANMAQIGLNLRISESCNRGGRSYMEDFHAIKCVKNNDRRDGFAYFAVFDGHGGPEAARFARDHLLDAITKYDKFWSGNDTDVMCAIRSGFLDTHQAMWKELDKWPRSVKGTPSTAGTTASIAIVKNRKLYVGHVGDSGIVLSLRESINSRVRPQCVTKDHKPENPEEKKRIENSGGLVGCRAGTPCVVWKRPNIDHKGPVRRSTELIKVPFLAVARSLGDFWSYDYHTQQFSVSPDPDVSVTALEPGHHQCLVLASDGLWNMVSPSQSVKMVNDIETQFEDRIVHDPSVPVCYWANPAEKLVSEALKKWKAKKMTADNISCVVVLIDPLGPSKLVVLRKRREEYLQSLKDVGVTSQTVSAHSLVSSKSQSGTSRTSRHVHGEEICRAFSSETVYHPTCIADEDNTMDVSQDGKETPPLHTVLASSLEHFPFSGSDSERFAQELTSALLCPESSHETMEVDAVEIPTHPLLNRIPVLNPEKSYSVCKETWHSGGTKLKRQNAYQTLPSCLISAADKPHALPSSTHTVTHTHQCKRSLTDSCITTLKNQMFHKDSVFHNPKIQCDNQGSTCISDSDHPVIMRNKPKDGYRYHRMASLSQIEKFSTQKSKKGNPFKLLHKTQTRIKLRHAGKKAVLKTFRKKLSQQPRDSKQKYIEKTLSVGPSSNS